MPIKTQKNNARTSFLTIEYNQFLESSAGDTDYKQLKIVVVIVSSETLEMRFSD